MLENEFTSTKESVFRNESNIYSYHLTLFSEADGMYELWLPKFAEGYYRFSNQSEHRFLSVVAKNGKWYAQCMKPAHFKDVPLDNSDEMPLADKMLLTVDVEDQTYLLLVEQVIPSQNTFKNYNTLSDVEIIIGSQAECDIYYRGPFVAEKHAMLLRTGGRWTISNLDTEYGIYINKEKCENAELVLGDVVYIMGLKLIIGQSFLTINSGLGEVVVNPCILQDMPMIHSGYTHYYGTELKSNAKFFNRAPRKRRESEQTVITVEGPPISMSQNQMPLMLRMGSSMVMGGTAAMAGNFMTLITGVMFPFLSSKYTDAQRKEYEQLRVTKYTEYLENKRKEILAAIQKEHSELNEKYPSLDQVAKVGRSKRLWERRSCDSDFLQLRLGTGTRTLSARIDYPTKRFELESDDLEDKMYQLVETPYKVEDAPIVLPLADACVCGIQGQRKDILSMIRNLVMQLAVHHSYDEVKLVFLICQEELSEIESVRYLPHAWDDLRNMRFVATNETEAYVIGEYMKNQLEDESGDKKDLSKSLKNRPYYVIFALDKKLLDGHEVFKQFLQEDQNLGVSVITAYDEVPKECQKIVSLHGQQNNTCTTMGIDGGNDEIFFAEDLTNEQFHSVMHLLANTSLKQVDKKQTMPKMVTFLEMLKVGRVEQLNSLKRWRENDPVKSLSTPVGVGEDGSVFVLDLHEKRQGPHGLVAGMTGSGKSEFLITYILSMAVNYHPDEVAFVLIDYKGGGLADAFENPRTGVKLPHLAGTITNLDGASIQRSLMCIESELVRRQKVFSEVGKDFDEGSMNIYTYQKLYRQGKVLEPMPHLFIISDEFAELKQQQPEFMDKLISAARIGRSLGVHLILATQKPSGIVNDQIRSNTKFRVCLRVQDRSDSQDMLKRPEAAELTDTGRFYLQVGYNEYFALGQSAWCGADYEPQDTVPVQRDDAVEFLDMTGQVVTKNKPKLKKIRSGMTQIGAVVQYLSELAESQNIRSHSLGVEPLPTKIEYASLAADRSETARGITALIGLTDDPMRQKQLPLYLDMMSFHHMALVGLAGSGKSTFFKTLVYSLVMKYTPEDVNFYIFDLSGGILSVFKNMPHCGAYIAKENELDFDRLLALIQNIVEERKRLFKYADVYSFDDYVNICKLPLLLVILDGWTNIHDFAKGQQYSLSISKYMREAANYGVRFLFSVNHLNEFSSKVNQELDYKIALQAKDKFEYNDILSLRNAVVPPEIPGRGLCNIDGRALEYQVAVPYCELAVREQADHIREDLRKREALLQNCKAAKCLPVVDVKLEYADFCMSFATDRIPLGFSMQTMKPIAIPLQQLHTMSMYFGNSIGVMPVIFNILSAFHREQAEVIILRRTSGTIFDKSGEMKLQALCGDCCSIWDTTAENVPKLFDLLVTEYIPKNRVPYRDEYCELNGIPATDKGRTIKAAKYIRSKTTPLLVLFESFADMVAADKNAVFKHVFGMLRGFNVYFVGCFYPEDESFSVSQVFRSFSQDDFSLLFGGQFHKQWITSIPSEFRSMDKVNDNYNRFIMKYRNGCHRMVMPCGELISADLDPDEKEII